MFTFELELPCQISSINTFDAKATELLQKYTDSYRSLTFIIHELLINSLEASFRRYGEEAAIHHSMKLTISQDQGAIDIAVMDQAGGIEEEEYQLLHEKSLDDLVNSENGRGLLMIEHMVDDLKMDYELDGTFVIKVRKEGVNFYDQ